MCTVSWIHEGSGYQVLCNRDELDSRLPGVAPRELTCDGVRYLAPLDGNFGGSWVAVNEFGITLALLNRPGSGAHATRSRGLLVRELMGAQSLEELEETMTGRRLAAFAGFSMVALEPARTAVLFEWDGRQLTTSWNAEQQMPLTSSSFDPAGVEFRRREEFGVRAQTAARLDAELLFEFHRSHGLHGDRPSAYTTCMHRSGAQTVSFTWVEVAASQVRMFYSPEPPCTWARGESTRLTRKESALLACG